MINFMRVDHRLLHGQTALSWFGATHANCILIANDEAAGDEVQKATFKMARPAGARLVVMSIDRSIDQLNSGRADRYDLMIIVGSIHDARRLIEGLERKPTELNLGGTRTTADTESLSSAVNVSERDRCDLRSLTGQGIRVYIQQVPTGPAKTVDL